ncbi:MAG: response regulator [Chloroflexi bacterium]|nr:response regulator [Chloroflexota bacterium]
MNPNPRKIIAWVEDDSPVIAPVVRPLERQGYQIQRFLTIREVLDNLDCLRECDLILLDIFVPSGVVDENYGRYTGLKLLQKLRNLYGIKKPVVVLSVLTDPKILKELKRQNVAATLRKPVLPSQLKETVERVLGSEQV